MHGHVLAIFGPTASGKSAVAAAIARRIPAELVSADSMQAYRGLPILTSQPEEETHLVAIWPLEHETSLGEYQRLAHAVVDRVLARGRTPVLVGGTGLYLRAALADLDVPPPPAAGTRDRCGDLYDRIGPAAAHALLASSDPEAARAVHPHDRRRVVRALELVEAGRSLRPAQNVLWTTDTRHPTLFAGLEVPREELIRQIEERTRRMFETGVQEEVAQALAGPVSRTAHQMIGLREVAELPREAAIQAILVRTRRYAAYQRKWMRRVPGLVTVRADRPPDEVADEILHLARSGKRVLAGRES